MKPSVTQFRNAHNYLADFIDEKALYLEAHRLIDFLNNWRCPGSTSNGFFNCVIELSAAMASKEFWQPPEIDLAIAWIGDLIKAGYPQPPRVDWIAKRVQQMAGDSGNGQAQNNAEENYMLPMRQMPTALLGDSLPTSAVLPKCPWANVAFKVPGYFAQRAMTAALIDSWALNMPCFPQMHLVVPPGEGKMFEAYVTERLKHVPNLYVHEETMPEPIRKVSNYRAQHNDFWADRYVNSDAEYIAFVDSDVMITAPMTCQTYFDESGRPYLFYRSEGLKPGWIYTSAQMLELAKSKRPDKWTYSLKELRRITEFDFMTLL